MKATIKLFRAVPIINKNKQKDNSSIHKLTIPKGFIFAPEVFGNHNYNELLDLINVVTKEISLTGEELNSTFHKSWNKIRDASIEQLVIEQVIHYVTTYGFQALGCYDKDSIFIPNEKLDIPQLKDDISLVVIKGYTKEELKEKILNLLSSGIALKEETIQDIVEVCLFVGMSEKDIKSVKNKEVKIKLYDILNIVPENAVEFLRYIVYKITEKTLLIKDKKTIAMIKEGPNLGIIPLFQKYKQNYGFQNLAEVFYRFKPIFLAFRTNKNMNKIVNQIRRLAVENHKPMKEDYLNEITSKINKGVYIIENDIIEALGKVNIFRKIRLAYALKFRTNYRESILYRVRNGKSYAKEFTSHKENEEQYERVYNLVLDSIRKDINKNMFDKKIYIPNNVVYALPATEKQFTGNFPSGSYVTVPKDMVAGIHWKDLGSKTIDLDLSLISPKEGKIGWDSSYRTGDRSILFSGDITAAPNGATELFYIKGQLTEPLIMMVNYYNYSKDNEVPFKIIVAEEPVDRLNQNYTVNPNNVITTAKTSIDKEEKILGLVVPSEEGCRLYFAEANIGKDITSSESDYIQHARQYLIDFYSDSISLNDILFQVCDFTDKPEDADINLSPEALEKDTIINMLRKK